MLNSPPILEICTVQGQESLNFHIDVFVEARNYKLIFISLLWNLL